MLTYGSIDSFACPSCEFTEVAKQSVQKRKAKYSVHSCPEDKNRTFVYLLGTARGICGHSVLPELESLVPPQNELTRSIPTSLVFFAFTFHPLIRHMTRNWGEEVGDCSPKEELLRLGRRPATCRCKLLTCGRLTVGK